MFHLCDLLVHDGRDVRHLAWLERQRLLKALPLAGHPNLLAQRWMHAEGDWLFRQALALGRPGLQGHRLEGRYRGGRSSDWITIPCTAASTTGALHG